MRYLSGPETRFYRAQTRWTNSSARHRVVVPETPFIPSQGRQTWPKSAQQDTIHQGQPITAIEVVRKAMHEGSIVPPCIWPARTSVPVREGTHRDEQN